MVRGIFELSPEFLLRKLKDLLEEHQGPIFRYETEKKEMKAFQKKIEIEDEEMEV